MSIESYKMLNQYKVILLSNVKILVLPQKATEPKFNTKVIIFKSYYRAEEVDTDSKELDGTDSGMKFC